MKKIAFIAVALLMSVAANAQFEKGKAYLGAGLSGFDLSSQSKQFHIGFDAKVGYLFADNVMALGEIGYDHWEHNTDDLFSIGAAVRYYIVQNGIYLGAGLKYKHAYESDLLPGVHAGYAFFLSRTVTLEPELYFDLSTKSSNYTSYGLRIGIGVYLFKDQYQFKR